MNQENIFSDKAGSVAIALLTCLLWGSLYPVIKIGYECFKISSGDIPTIVLFAGMRFTLSGIILIVLSGIKAKKISTPAKGSIKAIAYCALASYILHYSFTYIALSIGEGSKSAIIKQVGYLVLSCFAFLFDKSDKWSVRKMLAGILGFAGIIATSSDGEGFTFEMGDLLLVMASFCSVIGMIISKNATKTTSPSHLVSYSQLYGGIVLCLAGIFMGGKISYVDTKSILVFLYICLSSVCAYLMWNILLKYNNISKLSIIKFSEPLFAVVLSGIFLGENIFRLNYLIALIIILAAILLVNLKHPAKEGVK